MAPIAKANGETYWRELSGRLKSTNWAVRFYEPSLCGIDKCLICKFVKTLIWSKSEVNCLFVQKDVSAIRIDRSEIDDPTGQGEHEINDYKC